MAPQKEKRSGANTPTSFAVAGGHRLEYSLLNAGLAERPWLVFLHEGLGSVALWRDFPQVLCDATRLRGLVYSRYGYGKSDPLPATARPHQREVDFMHREAIDVLPELLAHVGITHPLLFGHSDGASIALLYAATYPDSAAAVVALAPHVIVEEISVSSIAKVRDSYLSSGLRERLARYHDDPDSAFWGWNDVWLNPAFRSWNIEALMTRIKCPLLAIQGLDDEYGTMAQIDSLAERVRGATLLKLPHCGHSPHKDQAQTVIEATQRFIAGTVDR